MTPIDYYKQKCQEGIIFEDPHQLAALEVLERVHHDLLLEYSHRQGIFSYFRRPHLVKGLYLWGGVGIGKTFLMDCFFHSLPFSTKMRMHFHQFMQRIHKELTKQQGHKDPLEIIATQLAKETLVLCFDEFYVSDITDAMLLGRLVKLLFLNGVCLVATSNIPPDDLYKNGLQRSQFIPAINLIKIETEMVHIPTTIDYRLRHLKEAGVFYTPLGEATQYKMDKSFNMLTQSEAIETSPVEICSRYINVKKRTKSVIWFDFADICSVPRSQSDYLAISKLFRTVFISDIPIIDPRNRDTICLFISLVDVFYDARVRLVFSAAEPVEDIYSRGYMTLEYTRTHSRLLEMQSVDYFLGNDNAL